MQAALTSVAIIGGICVGVVIAGPAATGLLAFPASIAAMTAALSALFLPAAVRLARDSAARAEAVAAEPPQVHLLITALAMFVGGFAVLAMVLAALAAIL